jgi:hypothetical protein
MANSRGMYERDYLGPELEDCNKVWATIVGELITDAGVRMDFMQSKNPAYRARVVVWSPGLDPQTGGPRDHIWATKELQVGSVAITYRQLYDLLIVAYRMMDAHLSGQNPLPLP